MARLLPPAPNPSARSSSARAQSLTQFLLHHLCWRHFAACIDDQDLVGSNRHCRHSGWRSESNSQIGKCGHRCIPVDRFSEPLYFILAVLVPNLPCWVLRSKPASVTSTHRSAANRSISCWRQSVASSWAECPAATDSSPSSAHDFR